MADDDVKESLVRLVTDEDLSDDNDDDEHYSADGEQVNGHRFKNGISKTNRRLEAPIERRCFCVLVLSLVLAASLFANVFFCVLLFAGHGGTAQQSSITSATQESVMCQHEEMQLSRATPSLTSTSSSSLSSSPSPSSSSLLSAASAVTTAAITSPSLSGNSPPSPQPGAPPADQSSPSSSPISLSQNSKEATSLQAENNVVARVECPNIPAAAPTCLTDHPNLNTLREEVAQYENIFKDLSAQEIQTVYEYLKRQTDLEIQPYGAKHGSHVYGIELHTPNKTAARLFLQGRGARPPREAQVVLERPFLQPTPLAQEIIVGPLPNPSYHRPHPRRRSGDIPYRFHPAYGLNASFTGLARLMPQEFHTILQETFDAGIINCGDKCLILMPQKTSSAYSDRTLIVLTAYYATDFVTLQPIGVMFVMKETRKDSNEFEMDSLQFDGDTFTSFEAFLHAYRQKKTPSPKRSFPKPAPTDQSVPGTMNLRGPMFPNLPQRGPEQFEPEGKRYVVEEQHVSYMQWSFNLRMSVASGPQLWDVRWAREVIAHEISLQDVAVIYAGANPTTFYAHLSDSAFGLGDKAYGLVPGVDCPEHATFLHNVVFDQAKDEPREYRNAFCVFEHNTGAPLRRHQSDDGVNGHNYGGVVDRVLVVRTALVEYNYDYIFDFVFHLNGAIELTSRATGYVMSQHYRSEESLFGYRIHEESVGSIHHHLMNFKIDLDILGTENRYRTLDFTTDKRSWPWLHGGQQELEQIAFRETLKPTEHDAVLRYNFSTPKYHIFYNDKERNKFGNHRGYRVTTNGFSQQLLPDSSPALASRAWSKYQMLVTERQDAEESSSSIFSMFDGESPHVNVEHYLKDNASIVDKDLVLWLTIGFHHIPHTEDVPNTPTVGASASILLLPYNYFPECPSVGSRDSVRVEAAGTKLHWQLGKPSRSSQKEKSCLPVTFDYEHFSSDAKNVFQ